MSELFKWHRPDRELGVSFCSVLGKFRQKSECYSKVIVESVSLGQPVLIR